MTAPPIPTTAWPLIYRYTSYRVYLAACLEEAKSRQMSVRAFTRSIGVTSPNYIQQVLSEQRHMTALIAGRLAEALGLDTPSTSYLQLLVKLSRTVTTAGRDRILTQMLSVAQRAERPLVKDEQLHSSWANPLLWEVLKTKHASDNPVQLSKTLRSAVSAEEIAAAFAFFRARGLLLGDDQATPLTPAAVDFKPSNDVRRIDLQRSHLRFLQLAEHRLNDDVSEREYQGLTMAVPGSALAAMREDCRTFIAALNDKYAVDAAGDDVVRVQLCVFKLTKT